MLMRARNIVKKCYTSSDKTIKKGVTVSMADKEEKKDTNRSGLSLLFLY